MGIAIYMAVDKVIDKARGSRPPDGGGRDSTSGGTFSVRGSPDHSLPLAAVAFEAFTANNLPMS